uniref:NFKB inhibitor epsilon n=1 Tax=Anas zonorhyncha TaxID=75864 RepID=A0A8B9V3V3_9AVES
RGRDEWDGKEICPQVGAAQAAGVSNSHGCRGLGLSAGHQALRGALVSLCPVPALPKGKDVEGRRGNRRGLARGLCHTGGVGSLPGSCLAFADHPGAGENRSVVLHGQQRGAGIPLAATRLQASHPVAKASPQALRYASWPLPSSQGWRPVCVMGPGRGATGAQRGRMGHMGLIFPFFFHLFPRCRLVHLAIIHCAPDVALFCIAHLPTEMLETQNDLFQTPLHLAVYLEQPVVVEALMRKGVNLGLQDRNGNTPLHLACEQQCLYCAQQLLQGTAEPPEHHQDLQLQNWQGET